MTEAGPAQQRLASALQYLDAWLDGIGAVAIYGLMEDAATAEISRSQVWQWLHNVAIELDDGGRAGDPRAGRARSSTRSWRGSARQSATRRSSKGRSTTPRRCYREMALADDFAEFLTLPAYERMP